MPLTPMRPLCLALLASAAFGQPAAPILADIERSHSAAASSHSIALPGDRLQIRSATLLNLVTMAWGLNREMVFGGATWLDGDRFDVLVQLPPNATPGDRKLVLRRLLTERFGLATHDDSKPIAVLALIPAARGPQFHPSAAGAPAHCIQNDEDGPPHIVDFTCQHATMADLASDLRTLDRSVTKPVVDRTRLDGAFDFTLRFTPLFEYQVAAAAGLSTPGIKFADALDKAGLRLDPRQLTLPVLIIDRVERNPTPNAPGIAEKLPPAPTEFDVAEIKPSKADNGASMSFGGLGGVVEIHGYTIRDIMVFAWGIGRDRIADAPKWFDADRFDIIAKAPPNTPSDDLRPMLKAFVTERLKLATHTADRPMPVFFLTAGKSPKLKPADTSARSECLVSRGQSGKGADAIPLKVYTCTNMTMTKFAKLIQPQAAGMLRNPVIDQTGLTGAYDFALSWTRTDIGAAAARKASEGGNSSDPTGVITIFDAVSHDLGLKLEGGKQYPMPVLIVDHAEPIAPDR